MRDYDVIELNSSEEFCFLVIICKSESFYTYLPQIENELKGKEGKIIVDQILHVGNTEKRFLSIDLERNKQNVIPIPKSSSVRKISCEYLRQSELLDYSILSSIQKRMIKKGIAI